MLIISLVSTPNSTEKKNKKLGQDVAKVSIGIIAFVVLFYILAILVMPVYAR